MFKERFEHVLTW